MDASWLVTARLVPRLAIVMAGTLPPFPVDDVILDAIEHSLQGYFTVDEDGEHCWQGSDMQMFDVFDFLAGYDPSKVVPAVNEYDTPIPDVVEYVGGPLYGERDLILALIAEVRRLRTCEVSSR